MQKMKQLKIKLPLRTLALAGGLLLATSSFAQHNAIKGHVKDATGEPVMGATIAVKGKAIGVTDIDGNFSIDATPGTELTFTFLGMSPQTVKASGNMTVTLSNDDKLLNEVVVIGYGTVKRNDLTGSINTVKPSEVQAGLATSAQDLLVGQAPGVTVTTAGGPEGSGTIRVRGGSSLNASNDPLIVIDGVPLDNSGVQGMGNPLSMIAPDNIENMTILKDASATAIYGSRASNGVIIITTKRGTKGKPQVNFSANMYVNTARKTYKSLSTDELTSVLTQQFGANSDPIKYIQANKQKYGALNTNWQDEVLRTTVSHDYNLSVGGTTGCLPYRISASYTNNNGILKDSRMDRATVGFNLTPEFLDHRLKIKANAKGYWIKNQFTNQGAVAAAIAMDPSAPIYNNAQMSGGIGGYKL